MYQLKENRPMKVKTFASLVSHALYEKRFGPYFVAPIVIGLDKSEPYVNIFNQISYFCIIYI